MAAKLGFLCLWRRRHKGTGTGTGTGQEVRPSFRLFLTAEISPALAHAAPLLVQVVLVEEAVGVQRAALCGINPG